MAGLWEVQKRKKGVDKKNLPCYYSTQTSKSEVIVLQQYLLLPVLIAAVIMDYRSLKISNRLIVAGLALGLILHLPYTAEGLLSVLWNISFPVILLYLFYLVGALGAGDVKLFSVVGAFVNFKVLFSSIVLSMVLGATFSLVRLFASGQPLVLLKNGCRHLGAAALGDIRSYERGMELSNVIHFSLPILLGTVGAMGYERFF